MQTLRTFSGMVLAALIASGWMVHSQAQTQTAWTNTLGGNWSESGNWNPNVVPGPGTP